MNLTFIPVTDAQPVKPGEYSDKLFVVVVNEFGFPPGYALVTCWISTLHPDDPRWYLPARVYNLDKDLPMGLTVTHYCELPNISELIARIKPLQKPQDKNKSSDPYPNTFLT